MLEGTKVCAFDWKNSLKVDRTLVAGHSREAMMEIRRSWVRAAIRVTGRFTHLKPSRRDMGLQGRQPWPFG